MRIVIQQDRLTNSLDKTGERPAYRGSQILTGVLCLLLGLLAGCSKSSPPTTPSSTEPQNPANVRSSADVVKFAVANLSVAPGSNTEATVTMSISPGFHVNANPATYPYLIATELMADDIDGIKVEKPIYPASEKKRFQFAEELLAVYEGNIQIKLPLRAESNSSNGQRSLPLKLRIQACDDEKCFPPDTLSTTLVVDVK